MKTKSLIINITIITLSLFFNISCEKENIPDEFTKEIITKGEGGVYSIKIENLDQGWNISDIINRSTANEINIYGDIYSADGKIIRENSILKLNGNGRMEGIWMDKGFIITRNSAYNLEIEVLENFTKDPFHFVIILQDGRTTKEIVVKQESTNGYTFENISYSLGTDDKDSLYHRKNMSFEINYINPAPFSFSPFGGAGILRTSYFISSDPNADSWIEDNPVPVQVPQIIEGSKIYLSHHKNNYGEITSTSYYDENQILETIMIPGGGANFYVELEYRKRVVSYVLTLINNRTKEERKIEGKWIENSPTGDYNIVKD